MSSILVALNQHLTQHRFVFWHDTDQQAESETFQRLPDHVELSLLDELPAIAIKTSIKNANEKTHFLFYSKQPQPELEGDWLLNLRLQAKTFYADAISVQRHGGEAMTTPASLGAERF
jgi:hypothetical protein